MKFKFCVLFLAILVIASCSPNNSSTPETNLEPNSQVKAPSIEQITEAQGRNHNTSILTGNPVSVDKGDWDSFGDPVMPPEPIEISGTYDCSAFLQDQVQRRARICTDCDEVDFRLYRLYRFEVNETNKKVEFQNLEFRKIAYFGLYSDLEHQQLEVEKDIQLTQPKVELSFSIAQDDFQDDEPLVLSVRSVIGQQFGDKLVLNYGEHKLSPEYGGSFSTSISVRNSNGEYDTTIPQLFLEVQCQKN